MGFLPPPMCLLIYFYFHKLCLLICSLQVKNSGVFFLDFIFKSAILTVKKSTFSHPLHFSGFLLICLHIYYFLYLYFCLERAFSQICILFSFSFSTTMAGKFDPVSFVTFFQSMKSTCITSVKL